MPLLRVNVLVGSIFVAKLVSTIPHPTQNLIFLGKKTKCLAEKSENEGKKQLSAGEE